MALIIDLFSTDYGLVALAATLASLALAWGFHAFIRKKVRESASAYTSDQ
jgi:peptidoglycan/LPS O-acetylase OafA/YrhL